MNSAPKLTTDRLTLRQWEDRDRDPFARLNADRDVMEYFPSPLTREESDNLILHMQLSFEYLGIGMWVVERNDDGAFLGAVGLVGIRDQILKTWPSWHDRSLPKDTHDHDSLPKRGATWMTDRPVEIGWRLTKAFWKMGYATEAARASLAYGFGDMQFDEICSMTSKINKPSQAVMERIGMKRDPSDDFSHPMFLSDHPLRAHVLYRLKKDAWSSA
jgi:ribosomal-protein-alanine N-acetyltransferase